MRLQLTSPFSYLQCIYVSQLVNLWLWFQFDQGRVQDFWKGGSNIYWFPKKRSSDFKRGGGVQYICLTRTTNLAYLDAKEWTNMYFEPLISVKCCPKLHIKQLRNNLHYICRWDRVGLEGGGCHRWKGGVQEKGRVRTPWPPSGHAYVDAHESSTDCIDQTFLWCCNQVVRDVKDHTR